MLLDLMVKVSPNFTFTDAFIVSLFFLLFRDLLHQAEEIVKLMKENQVCLKHMTIQRAWC